MYKLINEFKQIFIRLILSFKKFESSECIIIFSEARGGSTWLMEIMSTLLPTVVNWEPLHVTNGVVPKERNFGGIPFIPENNSEPENYILFQGIHEYKIHNKWTRKYLGLVGTYKSKYVLTKYVRANMLVPYLTNRFDFKHKPIFLLRHPIDTCLSQIKAFGKNNNNTVSFQVPNCINNERFIEHASFLKSLESRLEMKIALWCINNCYTLEKMDTSKVCIVFYSDLLLSPEKEIKRILFSLGLDSYNKNLNQVKFRKASSTDFKGDFNDSSQKQLSKNIDSLDLKTKDKIQEIFDHFNFKIYSAYTTEPNKEHLMTKASCAL